MYNSSAIKNEIIDGARDLLEKLVPKEAFDANHKRPASNNRSGSDSTKSNGLSLAMSMFEDNGGDIDDCEEDEVQLYINQHVRKMDGSLLEW